MKHLPVNIILFLFFFTARALPVPKLVMMQYDET